MAFDLTAQTKTAANAVAKTPQVIVEIDGISNLYTAVSITKVPTFDSGYVFDQENLYFDTAIEDINAKPWINLKNTTKNITQQLNQDKGGSGSVSNIKISIVDKENFVTNSFASQEMLSKRAKVYLSFENLEHPANSIRIFSGIISNYDVSEGEVSLIIDNPDTLKNQELFVEITDELDGSITNSDTTITLLNTEGIILNGSQPSPLTNTNFSTYVKIDDEVILVGGISGNDLTGCTRGQLGTVAASHNDEADVVTFYRLQGNPIDLALQLMLSNEDVYFYEERPLAFGSYNSVSVSNSIWFNNESIQDDIGLVVGDYVTITDSTSNDVVATEILSFGQSDSYSYIVVDSTIVDESVPSNCLAKMLSQYNNLPDGCGMGGEDVDVDQHLYVKATFGQSFPGMDFYLKEGINAKQFIEQQLYFPVGAYFLPRKGKSSIGYTAPAVGAVAGANINVDNITNAINIKVSRSIKKNFYNSVIYKLEDDVLEDRFLRVYNTLSADSQNRIKKGLTPFTVESKGLRNTSETINFIDNVSTRVLDRYQYAATSFTVQVSYGVGFAVEVGDIVTFDGTELGLYNYESGNRGDFYKLMEVTNKNFDITGRVTLTLTDTAYDVNGRYGTFAPSSDIGTGSTTTSINLKRSYGTGSSEVETLKWVNHVGNDVIVHNNDWSFSETVTLFSISETNGFNLTVSPALSSAPLEDYILETCNYDDAGQTYKAVFCFSGPSIDIASGTSGTVFTVSSASNLFVGAIVQVQSDDFTDFATSEIIDITGQVVTVETDLGFTPQNGDTVTRVGFVDDNGNSYLYL